MLNGQSQSDYVKEQTTFDPKQYLFSRGVLVLMERGGKNERQVRAFLGKCMKAAKDNPYPVMEALEQAQDKADPFAWMSKVLHGRPETEISDPFLKTLIEMPGMDRATVASYFSDAKITVGANEVVVEVPKKWTASRIKDNYMDTLRLAARGKAVEVRAMQREYGS